MAAAAADEGFRLLSEPAAGGDSDHPARRVRCAVVVHNIPDDNDDAASTIRSLLEPHVTVRHCQPSTIGLSHYSVTNCRALGDRKPSPRQLISQHSYNCPYPAVPKISLCNFCIRI